MATQKTNSERKFVIEAARLAHDRHCTDIVVLDLKGISPATDYFLIATGTSDRQCKSVADEISMLAREHKQVKFATAGYEQGRWVLLDYFNVIVHLFESEMREYYDLEMLWGDAKKIRWQKPKKSKSDTEKMKPVLEILEHRVSESLQKITGITNCPAMVRAAADGRFGDYQANGIMAAAKQIKSNPRQLAEKVVAQLNISDICQTPEIAGPGFINLRLKPEYLAKALLEIYRDNNLGIEKTANPQTVVVDYSGPNIAKEMHVGHLRSTIIGDCISRMLECLGHNVIRQNHIGDWGTQFGRAFLGLWHISMGRKNNNPYHQQELEHLRNCSKDRNAQFTICQKRCDFHAEDWRADSKFKLGDGGFVFGPFLERLSQGKEELSIVETEAAYQYVSTLDEILIGMNLLTPTREYDFQINDFKEILIPYEDLSRRVTMMLQRRLEWDRQEEIAWQYLTNQTLRECNKLYHILNVSLNDKDVRGESFYNDKLPDVIRALQNKRLAIESNGAVCVFPEGFKSKEGEPLPFIIQKSDGAYLYATTDLAAVRFRLKELGAKRIVYVTDARQALHFKMLFAVVKLAGWAEDSVQFDHVTFGTMLGTDGKPFKTRTGGTVKLAELLDEAVERAKAVVNEKNPDLDDKIKVEVAKKVGIGAVKYSDYSNNRDSDYIFSFDKMLAMDGNTAPYMQYAYARIRSIERKAEQNGLDIQKELTGLCEISLTDPAEQSLAKQLIQYSQAILGAAADCRPNYLTAYLYELSQAFSRFYNACPVLQSEGQIRAARLLLCDLTARTIQHGMTELLGIEVPEQM